MTIRPRVAPGGPPAARSDLTCDLISDVISDVTSDVISDARAARLADRLTAEGVAAVAVGSSVGVRPERWARAMVLARLFREVDEGRTRVAPAPTSAWNGSFARQMLAVALLGLIIVPTVTLGLLALAG